MHSLLSKSSIALQSLLLRDVAHLLDLLVPYLMTAILSPLAIRMATTWRLASTSFDALPGSSGYFARAIEIVWATRLFARRSSGSRAFSAWG
ncbi:MAG: hypothetical protein B7Y62_11390 [Sphingomonadales bacterium 35-56-22]|nr:MAG: hypothetical protein B7Y62_11390 [Sphingomonadales bacterium 35-56-22]OYY96318.1 MAG: hypothetical protein B7Y38_11380 [Sphingomonadales bacterium 28-56-43]OYZ59328.1 MAG: hypothetical protein B7Y10_11375 [Sphingomonadales bacterium 24-56-14]OZA81836.1 MAG: hypothetical protein B7X66_11255 [Sphingomonadales bacterium 39-57-19]